MKDQVPPIRYLRSRGGKHAHSTQEEPHVQDPSLLAQHWELDSKGGNPPSPQGPVGGPSLFCMDVLSLDDPAGPKSLPDVGINTHTCIHVHLHAHTQTQTGPRDSRGDLDTAVLVLI